MRQTPIQELIEVLKIHRDTARKKQREYKDLVLTEYYDGKAKAFAEATSLALQMFEKEEEVMCEFATAYTAQDQFKLSSKDYYDETFKTKER